MPYVCSKKCEVDANNPGVGPDDEWRNSGGVEVMAVLETCGKSTDISLFYYFQGF
jgi:hypothetical protein